MSRMKELYMNADPHEAPYWDPYSGPCSDPYSEAERLLSGAAPQAYSETPPETELSLSGRMPWDEAPSAPDGAALFNGTALELYEQLSAAPYLPLQGEGDRVSGGRGLSGGGGLSGGRGISPAKPILEPDKKVRALRTISSLEIAGAQYTPPPFVVEGLLPAGLTVFAAPPKTGKSWLCLELAHCVAQGRPFWGRKTQPGSVLYLDLESRDYRVQSRMEKTGISGAQALDFVFEAGRLDTDLMDQLSAYHAQHEDLRLVIVDTLARVKGVGRGRSDAYITDTMTLAPLQSWALGRGIAVICVTHMRKQGFIRADSDPFEQITGSNAQFGVADGAWLITGAREDRERTFIASGRDYEGAELSIRFEQDSCHWRCLGDAQDQERAKYEASPVVRTIRALLAESGGTPVRVTANDLLTAVIQRHGMVGYSPTSIGKSLKQLEAPLLRYDSILYTAPKYGGRDGRLHQFHFADSTQTSVESVASVDILQ